MYISEAAERSGTTVKTIRHYEAIGLLAPAQRKGNYRLYDLQSVERLRFIKCAKALGFRLRELQEIFAPHRGKTIPWAVARQAIEDKKREISEQLATLSRQHAQLVAFELTLEDAEEDCPLQNL
ncbi:MerR family transcriptional regulator [Pseudomonas sp. TWP3-1]|uniref:MerR family transcriptional regulator n=1 Tax=Pseudomonas sp. TWP3-1 TaxID=2804631 RepID=UPI003CEB451E